MKLLSKLSLAAAICLGLATTSCKKDDASPSGLQVQAHDQNEMMTIMHDMMHDMHTMSSTMDPDNDFAMMMKMHHQGAIMMAQKELAAGSNAEMKSFAQNVVTAQQAEITQLDAFLTAHQPIGPMVMDFHTESMASMEKMDRAADLRVITGNIDRDFAQLMQDHHQSAVEMAQSELKYGRTAAMKTLAQQIIDEQTQEIKTLQTWLLTNKGY